MESTVINAHEYRNLPIEQLIECPLNPRRTLDEKALNELAESIRTQGVLSPLLVRPIDAQTYEVVAGKRRFRAAQLAGADSVPVDIRELTDAQCLEIAIVENLQRRDVHPLEEANGYARLLALDEPKYSVEQIADKCGKHPEYILSRIRLTELSPVVVEAFTKDEIGLGHALLLAKLEPADQQQALTACWQETYSSGATKRILLPVRHLRDWIEHNIFLELAEAPFSKEDAALVTEAGSCLACPKRTGYNTLLFEGITHSGSDQCSDPKCYAAKLDAHIQKTVAAKPKLVQISTAYGKPAEGSPVVPRSRYVEIRADKPKRKELANQPEYKTCKYTTEAIVAEGSEKGALTKVCANLDCPIHHPKKANDANVNDAQFKAEQEKHRRKEAIANATGLRVLSAISAAVPVRMMKRDLLFTAERLANLLDENRAAILARQYGIKKDKENGSTAKLFATCLRRADESTLGRAVVEAVVLLTASRGNGSHVLREAAEFYKVDVATITATVKQEFAAKEKTRAAKKAASKLPAKSTVKAEKRAAA
jgi:ParB family transcriptional regulator, chromosome partitioning protein